MSEISLLSHLESLYPTLNHLVHIRQIRDFQKIQYNLIYLVTNLILIHRYSQVTAARRLDDMKSFKHTPVVCYLFYLHVLRPRFEWLGYPNLSHHSFGVYRNGFRPTVYLLRKIHSVFITDYSLGDSLSSSLSSATPNNFSTFCITSLAKSSPS